MFDVPLLLTLFETSPAQTATTTSIMLDSSVVGLSIASLASIVSGALYLGMKIGTLNAKIDNITQRGEQDYKKVVEGLERLDKDMKSRFECIEETVDVVKSKVERLEIAAAVFKSQEKHPTT